MSLASSLATTNKNVASKTSKVTNNGDKKTGKLGGMVDSVSGIQKNVAGTIVGVGNIVAKVAGGSVAKFLNGSTKISYKKKKYQESDKMLGLKGFYSQFGNTQKLEQVDRVDPFSTFECTFRFFPNVVGVQEVTKIRKNTATNVKKYDQTQASIQEMYGNDQGVDVGQDMGTATSDTKSEEKGDVKFSSTIGKLLQLIKMKSSYTVTETGGEDQDSEEKEAGKSEFENQYSVNDDVIKTIETTTVYETKSLRPIESDLHVDLGIYIQKVTLPNMVIEGSEESTTLVGKFPVPGNLVVPDNNTFSMDVVNVQSPIQENVFYPWMRETTLPIWSYGSQPFTTAQITVDFTEHSNVKYHFFGCRPNSIQLIQPDQSPSQNLTRNIQFVFDFMTVETIAPEAIEFEKQKKQKASSGHGGDKGGSMLNSALFSAANTLKF